MAARNGKIVSVVQKHVINRNLYCILKAISQNSFSIDSEFVRSNLKTVRQQTELV